MSDPSGPVPDIDVAPVNASALSIQVLDATAVHPGDYLRLGRANGADEGALPQDPLNTAANSPTIADWDKDSLRLSAAGRSTGSDGNIDVTPRTEIAASPFNNGTLMYSTGGLQIVAPNGYLRIGSTGTYETWLPFADDQTGISPDNARANPTVPGDGVMIFSEAGVHTIAPTQKVSADSYTTYTSDTLSVTGSASALVNAVRTWGSADDASTMTFLRMNAYQSQRGNVVSSVTGSQVSQYLGNMATSGIGMQMTANYGLTQNVFGGQTVTIEGGEVEVTGWRAASIATEFDQGAVGRLSLSCSPLVAAGLGPAGTATTMIAIVGALIAAVAAGALDVAMPIGVGRSWQGNPDDVSDTRAAMDVAVKEIEAIQDLTLVAQALAVLVGLIAKFTADASAGSPMGSIVIEDGLGIKLTCGAGSILVTPIGLVMEGPMIDLAGELITVTGLSRFM